MAVPKVPSMADPLISSEAFIKALKGSTDPVYEGGPTKIELAAEAFARSALYIPAKREIIAEWILSKLFKERKAGGWVGLDIFGF